MRRFVLALDDAFDVETPNLLRRGRKAKLRQRDAELRHPPLLVDSRRHIPHSIPRVVLVRIIEQILVSLHPGRVHTKLERRSPVVVRVDAHDQPVGR